MYCICYYVYCVLDASIKIYFHYLHITYLDLWACQMAVEYVAQWQRTQKALWVHEHYLKGGRRKWWTDPATSSRRLIGLSSMCQRCNIKRLSLSLSLATTTTLHKIFSDKFITLPTVSRIKLWKFFLYSADTIFLVLIA